LRLIRGIVDDALPASEDKAVLISEASTRRSSVCRLRSTNSGSIMAEANGSTVDMQESMPLIVPRMLEAAGM
jgi:hypothetical protein